MSDNAVNHERMEEMAAAYALGSLDVAETKVFEEHLRSGCPACEALVAEFRAVGDRLLLAPEPIAPSPALREKILAAAGVGGAAIRGAAIRGAATPTPGRVPPVVLETPRKESRGAGFWMPLALAAIVGLAFVSWQAYVLKGRIDLATTAVEESRKELEAVRSELLGVRASAEQQAALVKLLTQPQSGLVTLASLAPAPGASGKVLWDRTEGRGYLWVSNLPQDPEDKDYQLWAIADGKPVSAGVFSVHEGSALVPLDSLPGGSVAAFAITLEPAGGLAAPTLANMVLMGNTGG